MHASNDSADPFYTSLKAGAYASKKPSGRPCDPVYSCSPPLSKGAKIAIGVIITAIGLAIIGGITYLVVRYRHRSGGPAPPGPKSKADA